MQAIRHTLWSRKLGRSHLERMWNLIRVSQYIGAFCLKLSERSSYFTWFFLSIKPRKHMNCNVLENQEVLHGRFVSLLYWLCLNSDLDPRDVCFPSKNPWQLFTLTVWSVAVWVTEKLELLMPRLSPVWFIQKRPDHSKSQRPLDFTKENGQNCSLWRWLGLQVLFSETVHVLHYEGTM